MGYVWLVIFSFILRYRSGGSCSEQRPRPTVMIDHGVGVYFDREDGEHGLPKGKRVIELRLYRYVADDGKGERSSVNINPSGKR